MNPMTKDKINDAGVVLRFITPILIVIVGYLITAGIDDLKGTIRGLKLDVKEVNTHFTNHLSHHQDLEVGYAERMTKIEADGLTDKDGKEIRDEIMRALPPKYLLDRLERLEKENEKVKNRLERYYKKGR